MHVDIYVNISIKYYDFICVFKIKYREFQEGVKEKKL